MISLYLPEATPDRLYLLNYLTFHTQGATRASACHLAYILSDPDLISELIAKQET